MPIGQDPEAPFYQQCETFASGAPRHPDRGPCPPLMRALMALFCATCCLLSGAIAATLWAPPFPLWTEQTRVGRVTQFRSSHSHAFQLSAHPMAVMDGDPNDEVDYSPSPPVDPPAPTLAPSKRARRKTAQTRTVASTPAEAMRRLRELDVHGWSQADTRIAGWYDASNEDEDGNPQLVMAQVIEDLAVAITHLVRRADERSTDGPAGKPDSNSNSNITRGVARYRRVRARETGIGTTRSTPIGAPSKHDA